MNIEQLTEWSAPRLVTTRAGERQLRTGAATDAFWTAWRAEKEALKAAGVSCGRDAKTGEWQACWWQVPADQAQRTERKELSRAKETDFRFPVPDGIDPFPYQRAGVQFALSVLEAGRGCLIGDSMGLGKTMQAIGVINSTPEIRKVIVICPATLKINWHREFTKFGTRNLRVGVQNAGEPWVGSLSDVVIVNYDILGKFHEIMAMEWDLRIVDEAHYCKNSKAKRTKATFGIRAKRKLSLTGTPIVNRPMELFPILNDLDPSRWKNFFSYARKYCDAKQISIGRGRTAWDFSGASNLGQLQTILRETVMVRRLKEDVLTELPPKTRRVFELDVPEGAEHLVKGEQELWEEQEAEVAQAEEDLEVAQALEDIAKIEEAVQRLRKAHAIAFEGMSLIRHELAKAKVDGAIGYIEDALEGNGKLIVFCHHVDVMERIQAHFTGSVMVRGGMSSEEKMAAVDAFQTRPDVRVFIGNDAAAEGLNLTASTHVVFVESSWVPGNLSQKEDRAHRIGQKGNVLVTHLVFDGSLDSTMLKRVFKKQEVIDRALDVKPEERTVPVRVRGDVTHQPEARTFTQEVKALCLRGVQMLAGVCDGARDRDNAGFSGADVRIGHSFAARTWLSDKQTAIAVKMILKYHRQIPDVAQAVKELLNNEPH